MAQFSKSLLGGRWKGEVSFGLGKHEKKTVFLKLNISAVGGEILT